jgi:antitoxin ParD1/3/4
MDLSLTAEQQRFIDEKLKTGKYKSAADVVRDSLRIWMVQEAAELERHSAWASEVREKIDQGWQQAERGELVDGEEVFRRLKKRIEDRADRKRP